MAIKVSLPPPPAPSFDADAPLRSSTRVRVRRKRITPFGVEFFGRVQKTSLWFGALWCAVAWVYSGSWNVVASLALGCAVSMVMLHSQVWSVTKLIRPKSEGGGYATRMMWVVQPLKYGVLMVLLWWALRVQMLNAAMFALGVFLTPFVILAKAIGRAISFEMKSIAEAYGTPGDESSTRS